MGEAASEEVSTPAEGIVDEEQAGRADVAEAEVEAKSGKEINSYSNTCLSYLQRRPEGTRKFETIDDLRCRPGSDQAERIINLLLIRDQQGRRAVT